MAAEAHRSDVIGGARRPPTTSLGRPALWRWQASASPDENVRSLMSAVTGVVRVGARAARGASRRRRARAPGGARTRARRPRSRGTPRPSPGERRRRSARRALARAAHRGRRAGTADRSRRRGRRPAPRRCRFRASCRHRRMSAGLAGPGRSVPTPVRTTKRRRRAGCCPSRSRSTSRRDCSPSRRTRAEPADPGLHGCISARALVDPGGGGPGPALAATPKRVGRVPGRARQWARRGWGRRLAPPPRARFLGCDPHPTTGHQRHPARRDDDHDSGAAGADDGREPVEAARLGRIVEWGCREVDRLAEVGGRVADLVACGLRVVGARLSGRGRRECSADGERERKVAAHAAVGLHGLPLWVAVG
jgi:hypothetical protein